MEISIALNIQKNAFILTPVDFSFSAIRGVNVYVKTINNGFLHDGIVEIPIASSDINQVYTKINELFVDRWNCTIKSDENSNSTIAQAQEEAEKFKLFSQKAYPKE